MEKDEILEKAQKENKKQDLADKDATNKGAVVGLIAGAILAGIFEILFLVRGYKIRGGFISVVFIMESMIFWTKWFKLRKRHELVTAICCLIASLCSAATFILTLFNY